MTVANRASTFTKLNPLGHAPAAVGDAVLVLLAHTTLLSLPAETVKRTFLARAWSMSVAPSAPSPMMSWRSTSSVFGVHGPVATAGFRSSSGPGPHRRAAFFVPQV